jgi:hypothetical protein
MNEFERGGYLCELERFVVFAVVWGDLGARGAFSEVEEFFFALTVFSVECSLGSDEDIVERGGERNRVFGLAVFNENEAILSLVVLL